MHQVNLNDQIYQEAQRRASEAGFACVDEFIEDVLHHDFQGETENLDFLFTPERLAYIDRSAAQIDAGHYFTQQQATEELAKRRAQWLRQNPNAL